MPLLTDEEREALGAIAWQAVIAAARGERRGGLPPDVWEPAPGSPASSLPPGLLEPRGGIFVSLHRAGDLRGCIGRMEAAMALAPLVDEMAIAAATSDPRFSPLCEADLDGLDVEISLLGPLVPIDGPDDLVLGRDGVLVRGSGHTGVLLPQVAAAWGFDRREFVEQVCRKAGLSRDAWQSGARLFRFEAEIFDAPRPGRA